MEKFNQVGLLIMIAVSLIVGVVVLQASAQQIGDVTNTRVLANQTLGTLTNGTTLYVTNCRTLTSVIIFNATGDVAVPATNYTLTNEALDTSGNLAVKIVPLSPVALGWSKGVATIDGVCQPTTYDNTSGGRAIAGIIIVMFAIALAIVALYPTLKEKFF